MAYFYRTCWKESWTLFEEVVATHAVVLGERIVRDLLAVWEDKC